MDARERLENAGYEDVVTLSNYSYDDALIGVTDDGRAIYDYDRMVTWLMVTERFTEEEAVEWVDYNTIRALPYMGENAPIIMHRIELATVEGVTIDSWDREEVWEAIREISDIKAQYDLFDPEQRPKHHVCNLAIKALREVIGDGSFGGTTDE